MDKEKNKKNDIKEFEQNSFSGRKIKNKINSFLNSNFQYFSFLMLFFVFWFSFNFILVPKYEKVTLASNEVLESKKSLFVEEYKELVAYKKNIEVFESINEGDIEKISKMIPTEYSKDEIFMEFAYFLMKNNFNIKSLKVHDPKNVSLIQQQSSSRRMLSAPENNPSGLQLDSKATQVAYSLPPNIGSWLLKVELSPINYFDLKYLSDVIENNLKLIDIISLDFDPLSRKVSFEALAYYFKK